MHSDRAENCEAMSSWTERVTGTDLPKVSITSSDPVQETTLFCQITHARHHTMASPTTNFGGQKISLRCHLRTAALTFVRVAMVTIHDCL